VVESKSVREKIVVVATRSTRVMCDDDSCMVYFGQGVTSCNFVSLIIQRNTYIYIQIINAGTSCAYTIISGYIVFVCTCSTPFLQSLHIYIYIDIYQFMEGNKFCIVQRLIKRIHEKEPQCVLPIHVHINYTPYYIVVPEWTRNA
jgi:hypothetical protein